MQASTNTTRVIMMATSIGNYWDFEGMIRNMLGECNPVWRHIEALAHLDLESVENHGQSALYVIT